MNGKRIEIFPEICKSNEISKRLHLYLLYQSTRQQKLNLSFGGVELQYFIIATRELCSASCKYKRDILHSY
jgi:hypothetical protein